LRVAAQEPPMIRLRFFQAVDVLVVALIFSALS
jgi:hypothetical protein